MLRSTTTLMIHRNEPPKEAEASRGFIGANLAGVFSLPHPHLFKRHKPKKRLLPFSPLSFSSPRYGQAIIISSRLVVVVVLLLCRRRLLLLLIISVQNQLTCKGARRTKSRRDQMATRGGSTRIRKWGANAKKRLQPPPPGEAAASP